MCKVYTVMSEVMGTCKHKDVHSNNKSIHSLAHHSFQRANTMSGKTISGKITLLVVKLLVVIILLVVRISCKN